MYVHVPNTWHDPRQRHAMPKPRWISAWSRQRSLQRSLLRRFKSGVACIKGLLVSSRGHASESTHLHIYKPGIPLASDMQPRSHPSPPDVCSSAAGLTVYHRHTAPHSTRPATAQTQRIEITTETHQPTGVSAPEHNSTIGPNLPLKSLSTRARAMAVSVVMGLAVCND
jgi:hypothetical protein